MTRPSGTMSDFSGTVEFTLESVNWEPICKLVIDENAKLRESNDMLAKMLGDRTADCYKLRELVRDMWQFTGAACKKYPRLFDPFAQGGQMVQPNFIDAFEQRMRELGIEVRP